jgi:site-specific recombinase XerD
VETRYPHLPEFLAHFQKNDGAARRSIESYERWIKQFLDWMLKNYGFSDVKRISKEHFRGYRDYLQNSNFKIKTITSFMQSLKTFFRYLAEMGVLTDSPYPAYLTIKGEGPREHFVPTPTEIFRMRRKRNVRFEHAWILEVLLSSGMRIDELVQTRACDINLNDRPFDQELKQYSPYFTGSINLGLTTHTTKRSNPRKVYLSYMAVELTKKFFVRHNIDPGSTVSIFPWDWRNSQQWLYMLGDGIVERYLSTGNNPNEANRERNFTDLDVDELAVSDDFKKLIKRRQDDENNIEAYKRAASQPAPQKKRMLHPHSLRYAFTSYMYYRNPFGERRDEQRLRILLGHRSINVLFVYLRDLNLVSDDPTWQQLYLGKPEDWSGINR